MQLEHRGWWPRSGATVMAKTCWWRPTSWRNLVTDRRASSLQTSRGSLLMPSRRASDDGPCHWQLRLPLLLGLPRVRGLMLRRWRWLLLGLRLLCSKLRGLTGRERVRHGWMLLLQEVLAGP